MNAKTLKILLRKEVSLFKRNPIIPRLIVGMPILVMLIVPLVTTFDVKNVGVAVVDNDRTELSRRMVTDMDASEYLSVTGCHLSYDEAFRQVESGEADVLVTIPKDYLKDLINGQKPELDIKANGVNATKGTLGAQYATMSVVHTLTGWQAEQGLSLPLNENSVVNQYNPTLDFRNYMIPALMVVLLIIICGFLPALNLVSEKESGTIEAMNVTPVGRFEFILSKLIPYWVVGILVVTVGMLIGWLVYGHHPAKHLPDVRLHRHLPADERAVHAHCLHAPVGTMVHLRHPAPLLHRNHACRLSERRYPGRPMGAVHRPNRLRRPDQLRGGCYLQEEDVDFRYR